MYSQCITRFHHSKTNSPGKRQRSEKEKTKKSSLHTHLGGDFGMGLHSRAINDSTKYYPGSHMVNCNRFSAGNDNQDGNH